MKILALKAKKAMNILDKDGMEIVEMFFPNCMYSYLMKDKQLDLIGICDKIEIIDGKYYPISFKSSKPPLKGTWDSDAIELAANAILIEEEFDTEVFVGFVKYSKIDDKRPVIIDMNLRKGLFSVLNEVKEIIINKKIKVKINEKKCRNCRILCNLYKRLIFNIPMKLFNVKDCSISYCHYSKHSRLYRISYN